MTAKNSYTYKLTPEQQAVLVNVLKTGNYLPVDLAHTKIAVKAENCNVALYKSGKCLIQGKGSADFITFVLEPMVLGAAQFGYEEILNPQSFEAHMGIDESGKGDLFGPLVIAAAYVDKPIVLEMQKLGVCDSKNITSDKKALKLASDIRKLLGRRFAVIKIGPEAYNRLYSKMRNVNSMLAWAHARAIENLLDIVPDCPRAISDQFGKKESVINALMKKGKKIELEQRHKAEEDMAVAAASILARADFLLALLKMGQAYKVELPKGASPAVKDAGEVLVKKHGPEILLKVAKCHFKTTDEVLQRAGTDRSVLGPEGQAVSRAFRPRDKKKS